MGGNVGSIGSASPSSAGSAAPSGGKGSAAPIQSYQAASPFASPGQSLPNGVTSNNAFGWETNPNISFLQQAPTQQTQQPVQMNGSLGLGQTAQSGQQQYTPNPQQMGIQGLLGGYGKGNGGAMPNPYQQTQQQGGMPMQQQHNPASDDGMVGPGYQQQQPMYRTTEARWDENERPQPYQAPDPSQPGFLGMNPNQQGIQQAVQNFTQQAQQAPVQQPSNMFYNMSAADIDKFNSQPRGQSSLAAPAALDSGMVGRNQQVLTPEQTAAMQQASMKKGGKVK